VKIGPLTIPFAWRWLPFVLGCGAFLAAGAAGWLPLNAGTAASAGALWVLWLLGHGLRLQALGFALLLTPLAWQPLVAVPRAESALRGATPGTYVRVGGIVRDWERGPFGLRFRLGQATIDGASRPLSLAELNVALPVAAPEARSRQREIRIGGRLRSAIRNGGTLTLALDDPRWHLVAPPIRIRGGERLRQALADRAGYYLPNRTLAVYLPIVLGLRDSGSPEARAVTGAFNRVGVAHLFAISGLNVTLLYLLLLPVARVLWSFVQTGQGWIHQRAASRVTITLLLWGYIALIGFPAPAVRAASMGSLIVWSQLWGTRASPVYVLVLAAAGMLAWDPSQIHDLSFQLTFLSYALLIAAVALWSLRPAPEERGTWGARLLSGAALNLLITSWITVGLWPLIAEAFRRFSLLVFVGNLLLVPLMSVAILPAGMVAFLTSLLSLGAPPGTLIERLAFGALDGVLSAWVSLVEWIDVAGEALVFRIGLEWSPRGWFLYYAGSALAFVAVFRLARRWRSGGAGEGS
jgi:ComEC/Rec2-related protein